jgi:hypothetical protein
MKLIRSTKTRLVFDLGQREEQMLLRLLKLYPCVPPAHHVLSKAGRLPDSEANQQLLDEALAEQRAQHKKQLQTLLADPRRLEHTESGARLSLSSAEAEWFMQVLNDIRVGSWILLGSPDGKPLELTPEKAPHFVAMERAGYFQMQLLEALEREM